MLPFLSIILLYESTIYKAFNILEGLYDGDEHPLVASNSLIPKRNTIPYKNGEASYGFHGIGCWVKFEGYYVDFDFWQVTPYGVYFNGYKLEAFIRTSSNFNGLRLPISEILDQIENIKNTYFNQHTEHKSYFALRPDIKEQLLNC